MLNNNNKRMGPRSFDEIKDYYYCILKVRLGAEEYNSIINDHSIDEIFYQLRDKYKLISQLPNHIHIMTLLNKFRIDNSLNYYEKNKLLLRSVHLLAKFQYELNKDFELKSESDMIILLEKLVNEFEQINFYSE